MGLPRTPVSAGAFGVRVSRRRAPARVRAYRCEHTAAWRDQHGTVRRISNAVATVQITVCLPFEALVSVLAPDPYITQGPTGSGRRAAPHQNQSTTDTHQTPTPYPGHQPAASAAGSVPVTAGTRANQPMR